MLMCRGTKFFRLEDTGFKGALFKAKLKEKQEELRQLQEAGETACLTHRSANATQPVGPDQLALIGHHPPRRPLRPDLCATQLSSPDRTVGLVTANVHDIRSILYRQELMAVSVAAALRISLRGDNVSSIPRGVFVSEWIES
jgi:hypothetical protein